ncbi:hypothetical protein [Rhizobium leguminosarum]|uniref:hypothetical protein n=1 Tax=Rhizobium leguminosarum TaxID=384 RepID=UPI001C983513|nr:hypothetical protein [Rhizobium leguminosarum]MBY5658491.1 hypothetical protein [Rhizobium leguminosarum]
MMISPQPVTAAKTRLVSVTAALVSLLPANGSRAAEKLNLSIERCSADTLYAMKPTQIDVPLLRSTLEYCYTASYYTYAAREASVRYDLFTRQIFQNEVMLWMVVAITISGVILAGLQLFASYKISVLTKTASFGDADMTFKADSIAIKSSLTGVLILVSSFLFFFVYVYFVFTIHDPPPESTTAHDASRTDAGQTAMVPAELLKHPLLPNGPQQRILGDSYDVILRSGTGQSVKPSSAEKAPVVSTGSTTGAKDSETK